MLLLLLLLQQETPPCSAAHLVYVCVASIAEQLLERLERQLLLLVGLQHYWTAAWISVCAVFRLHGMPLSVVSDRDPRFTSEFWQTLMQTLGVQWHMSSAFHPQTDGQTERVNRVVEDMLRHYVSPTQHDWHKHLPLVEFAINNSWHESVQATPFELVYGRRPETPFSVLFSRGGEDGLQPRVAESQSDSDRMPSVKQLRAQL